MTLISPDIITHNLETPPYLKGSPNVNSLCKAVVFTRINRSHKRLEIVYPL